MGDFKFGEDVDIEGMYIGDSPVTEVYLGDDLVWSASGQTVRRDDFNRTDTVGLGSDWTSHGPAAAPYLLSVVSGSRARINIPTTTVSTQTSRMRYNAATQTAEDGHVEVVPASIGSSGAAYTTRILRRLTDAAWTDGVGIELNEGQISIISLIGSNYATQLPAPKGGSYVPGDTIRLIQEGNVHTVTVNGKVTGAWDDDQATAHKGTGYSSIGIEARGDSSTTGYYYSPAIDSISFS